MELANYRFTPWVPRVASFKNFRPIEIQPAGVKIWILQILQVREEEARTSGPSVRRNR